MRKTEGSLLIYVFAVLLLISMMLTLFFTLTSFDKLLTRNYMESLRSKVLAQTGVENAIARLRSLTKSGLFDYSDLSWMFNNTPSDLTHSKFPSFKMDEINIEGNTTGISYFSPYSMYGVHSDVSLIKVRDSSALININTGLDYPKSHSVNQTLARMLNTLSDILELDMPAIGDKIISNRPYNGYTTKHGIARLFDGKIDKFRKLSNFITIHAWEDEVANPVPLSSYTNALSKYKTKFFRPIDNEGEIFRYGHGINAEGKLITTPLSFFDPTEPSNSKLYAADSLSPQWIEIVKRSPVNINTAPREVIQTLITDLQGFFSLEKRGPNALNYTFLTAHRNSLDHGSYIENVWGTNQDVEAVGGSDETGNIYLTTPYTISSRYKPGISPLKIAEEIIACREKQRSKITQIDYSKLNYGGKFTNWQQFNRFVDSLVENNLIVHNGHVFEDAKPEQYSITELSTSSIPSEIQKKFASFACADVLKANFNPNLHLNEVNPDNTIYTLVDKTDLIINSTEFCFLPTGYFEISSTGLLLQPIGSNNSVFATDNKIVSSSTVDALVKLFDVHKQSSQSDFIDGEISHSFNTENNLSLTIGPEPTVINKSHAEYDGYIRLSTTGGYGIDTSKSLYTNHSGDKYSHVQKVNHTSNEFDSTIHSHFQTDFCADYHSDEQLVGDKVRLPLGKFQYKFSGGAYSFSAPQKNYPDKSEHSPSPYSMNDDTTGKTTICKSYRYSKNTSAFTGYKYAPSDLRSDGAYFERHSAVGYPLLSPYNYTSSVLPQYTSYNPKEGAISFWLKPNFFPQLSSKMRCFVSLKRYQKTLPHKYQSCPFSLYFSPGFNSTASDMPPYLLSPFYSNTPFLSPASLLFGLKYGYQSSYNFGMQSYPNSLDSTANPPTFDSKNIYYTLTRNYALTPRVNYLSSYSQPLSKLDPINLLSSHSWTHIALTWKLGESCKILINGQEVPNQQQIITQYNGTGIQSSSYQPIWHINGLMDSERNWIVNPIRIGGEISLNVGDQVATEDIRNSQLQNLHADSTIDEFFYWNDSEKGAINSLLMLSNGRYIKPDDFDQTNATFTSSDITLKVKKNKKLPPKDLQPTPFDHNSGITYNASLEPEIEILGVSWTSYPEVINTPTSGDLENCFYDYFPYVSAGLAPSLISPAKITDKNGYISDSPVLVSLHINAKEYEYFANSSYSKVNANFNKPKVTLAYKIKFRTGSNSSSILLSTPIFDDISIFYSTEKAKIVYYIQE